MILNKDEVKKLFETNYSQGDVLIALYKMVLPEWDRIAQLRSYPEVNESTWKAICKMFMDFDRRYHKNVVRGGLWMNSGFSHNNTLKDWEVCTDNIDVIMEA